MLKWKRKLFRSAFSEDFPASFSSPECNPRVSSRDTQPPLISCAATTKRRHRLSSGEPSKLIRSFGKKGHKPGQFSTPTGVAVTRHGDVIVVDTDNCRLQVFGSDSRLRTVLGSKGSLPHQFNHPMCVSLSRDPAENLLITDSVNASVKIWQQDGTFVTEYAQDGIFEFPCGIATTSEHHIVVTDLCQHCVTVLHKTGTLRNRFGSYGDKVHQFDHPYFLAVSKSDVIFVSDSGNTCIKSFNLDGKLLQYFNMVDFRLPDECFILLQGITVDSENHVLIIGNSSIYICAQNGRMWEVIIPSEDVDLHSPKGLAHSPSLGQIVVTQVGLDQKHEVSVFDYHSEDYHSLKCVPYLTYEGRARDHLMRKAKSLDSSGPTTTKYFPSHVNGYVAPPLRKASSQKSKGSRDSKQKSSQRNKETNVSVPTEEYENVSCSEVKRNGNSIKAKRDDNKTSEEKERGTEGKSEEHRKSNVIENIEGDQTNLVKAKAVKTVSSEHTS